MKKLLFFLSLLITSSGVFAQHRSEQEAMQIAQEFFNKKGVQKKAKLSIVTRNELINSSNHRAANCDIKSCYIINDVDNDRFVIVSADERLREILGYSDKGMFVPEHAPTALLNLIEGYDRELDYVTNNSQLGVVSSSVKQSNPITPMITTKWGQYEPFNAECPKDPDYGEDTLCVTGCIATAMAQILNYYKYPSKGIGSYIYFPYKHTSSLQYVDFGNLEINWDNLVDDYSGASDEQKAEVAKLMHACGVSVSMNYCYDGSGAQDYDIPYALIHYFGYNPNVVYRNRDYYTYEEWDDMIMEDLKARRPVLYSGYNNEHKSGHEFIIDGCDENGLYHVNFGHAFQLTPDYVLSGIGDGYYALDAVGSALTGDYSYYQSMVCNITPEISGIHEDVFYAKAFNLLQLYSSMMYISIIAQCYSSDATSYKYSNAERFEGTIGIGLFDSDLNYIASMMSEPVSIKSDSIYEKKVDLNVLKTSAMEEGKDYKIALYAQANHAEKPTVIRSKPIILSSSEYNIDVEGLDESEIAYNYYPARLENGNLVIKEFIVLKTGIDNVRMDNSSGAWYTLQGVRLNDKPSKPGIYVRQGRKVVVK